MRMRFLPCLLALLPVAAHAAINPAEYTRDAPIVLQLRPTVRIVDTFVRDGDRQRRTTLVGEVVVEYRETADYDYILGIRDLAVGDTVTIDWTENLDQQARDGASHARMAHGRPGPQFLHAPTPPAEDADGLIWAHLQPDTMARPEMDAARAAAHAAGDDAPTSAEDIEEAGRDQRVGPILAPAAFQYSFDPPSD